MGKALMLQALSVLCSVGQVWGSDTPLPLGCCCPVFVPMGAETQHGGQFPNWSLFLLPCRLGVPQGRLQHPLAPRASSPPARGALLRGDGGGLGAQSPMHGEGSGACL